MNILFFIGYLSFVILFCFLHLPKNYRLTGKIVLRRNPRWLRNHPDVLSKVKDRKLATQASYSIGIVLIVLLGFAVVADTPLVALTSVYLVAIVIIAIASLVEVLNVYRFYRIIPPPDAREADLARKGLSDYVPMPLLYVALVILAGGLVGYVYAYFFEIIPTQIAVGRIVGITGILFLTAIWYLVMFRRPGYHWIPSGAQQIESYILVVTMCLAVVVLFWRIANDFFSAFLLHDTYVFFGSSIILQFAPFLYLLRNDVRQLVEQSADDILDT